ncbi:MAG: heavy metal-binding domain-containing protein [Candidatus Methanomethylicaceae archaeon]|nr:heavy metal-binding domain-containing protein [Candidatus Verstraetearchaeota archaeon]
MEEILVVTTDSIPGYKIKEIKGIVKGGIVRATHLGRDIMATLRNITGGEIKEYTQLLAEAREEAFKRMLQSAKAMGANAIIGFRFATSTISTRMAEIYAYGTAVVIEKE